MALVVVLLGQVLPSQWHPGSRLAIQVAIGVASWVGALLVLSMPTARRLLALARELVGAGSAKAG